MCTWRAMQGNPAPETWRSIRSDASEYWRIIGGIRWIDQHSWNRRRTRDLRITKRVTCNCDTTRQKLCKHSTLLNGLFPTHTVQCSLNLGHNCRDITTTKQWRHYPRVIKLSQSIPARVSRRLFSNTLQQIERLLEHLKEKIFKL